ncbi:MAG: MCE family protein [Alphaproteobacteria bacterium]|nr:MCE family protein [Alphaproteobacteria bacterium]
MNEFTKEELRNFNIGLGVLAFCLVAFMIFKLNHSEWENAENSDYIVYATYNRTDGIGIGDKVRMAGIDIGYIANSVLEDDFRAMLTLKIRKGIQIPDDSGAAIVSTGIMGNKYIEVEPGGSEDYIADGGEFVYTQDAIILEELIDRIISMGKAKLKVAAEPATISTEED